jgi:hypothetical protein
VIFIEWNGIDEEKIKLSVMKKLTSLIQTTRRKNEAM